MQQILFPSWLAGAKKHLLNDLIAGLIVGVLVIPQSLGYALIAGLPPVYGLYAAIVPVLVYAWVGSSSAVAVGPVAIMAIMTAQALQPLQLAATDYIAFALLLSFLSGVLLLFASVLKLGWITQFMSRGVVAGFVSGAGILIGFSQLKYLTGADIKSSTVPNALSSLWQQSQHIHTLTLCVGLLAFFVFLWVRFRLKAWLVPSLSEKTAAFVVRVLPVLLVVIAIIISHSSKLHTHGVAVIGNIPSTLPPLTVPSPQHVLNIQTLTTLLPSVALIALIAFVSSASLGGQFARLRHETFNANKELKALGLANISGAFFSSFPVTGGFSRTAINVDAGAKTPLASMFAALLMLAALLFLGKLLEPLPYAVLGAGIMAAIFSLIDIQTLKSAWQTDRHEAWCYLVTLLGVLFLGLNIGLVTGLLFSFALLVWRSSQPHLAVVGQVGSSEHFRNVKRHQVTTYDNLCIIRIDESLFFGNATSIKNNLENIMAAHPKAKHLILVMSAVNHIDLAAQDMLHELNNTLVCQQKKLHFAFVKGPVMDSIGSTILVKTLSGQIFLNTIEAVNHLKK